jgi:toxin-antitoxin system PIN domain toxin
VILPDVNVLLYAFRKDAPGHDAHREWLDGVVNGVQPYGISPQTLASVVRISTHRQIYAHPSSVAEALEFCRAVLEPDHGSAVQPGQRHWAIFDDLCRRSKATGNLVPDAWFAALAIESGCEWITNDRDYARFPGLRWREPF